MFFFQDIEVGEVMVDCLVSSVKASLEGVSKKVPLLPVCPVTSFKLNKLFSSLSLDQKPSSNRTSTLQSLPTRHSSRLLPNKS